MFVGLVLRLVVHGWRGRRVFSPRFFHLVQAGDTPEGFNDTLRYETLCYENCWSGILGSSQYVKERGLGFFEKQGRRSRPPATLRFVYDNSRGVCRCFSYYSMVILCLY